MDHTTLNPYLNFGGNAREAMEFYHGIFGGELNIQTFGQAPGMDLPAGYEDKVLHAHLKFGQVIIMASETQPGTQPVVGNNVHLSLNGQDKEVITQWFNALAEGGKVDMPLAEQFWGDTFGMLTDKFVILWMANIEK